MIKRIDIGRRENGFSLLEVLVAFGILVTSLVAITDVFSTGLRAVVSATNYQQVASYARSKLAAVRAEPLQTGTVVGRFNEQYYWELTVNEPEWADKTQSIKAYEITLTVNWKERNQNKSYIVSTIGLERT